MQGLRLSWRSLFPYRASPGGGPPEPPAALRPAAVLTDPTWAKLVRTGWAVGMVDGLPDVLGQKVGGYAGPAWISDWPSAQAGIETSIPSWDLYRGHVASRSGTKMSSHVNRRFERPCS